MVFIYKIEGGVDKEIVLGVFVLHPKRRKTFWACVKDNTTEGKDDYKSIGLILFDYKTFEEEDGWGGYNRHYTSILI